MKIWPLVDQINLRDCCDVPHDLLEFAKQAGIKLIPHMDEENPLPKETLQEVLYELGVPEQVAEMRWVVKYTAVVKDRGVIENKEYFSSLSRLIVATLYQPGLSSRRIVGTLIIQIYGVI